MSPVKAPLLYFRPALGDVAQLGEHRVRIAGVRGSSPLISTSPRPHQAWRILSSTIPVLQWILKRRPEAETNLRKCGVWDSIRLHCRPSHEFWPEFNEPIRLLWHDGANDRDYVAGDIAAALPKLSDRAIVAFHDVLNCSGERLHSFVDHVLARARSTRSTASAARRPRRAPSSARHSRSAASSACRNRSVLAYTSASWPSTAASTWSRRRRSWSQAARPCRERVEQV